MTDATAAGKAEPAADDIAMRGRIDELLREGRRDAAIQIARMLLRAHPGARTWRFLAKAARSDTALKSGMRPLKVALLSSFSIELVHDALLAHGFVNGLRLELHQGGFGTFRQELLDPASALHAWSADAVVLAVQGEDWFPEAYGSERANGPRDASRATQGLREDIGSLIQALRARSNATFLIHNFAPPTWRRLGMLDAGSLDGQARLVDQLNDALRSVAESAAGVHLVDYAGLVSRNGALRWHDQRMRLYAGAPIAQPMFGELAREYVKYFRCLVGLNRKCLVLDLDNTLWGGVLGEEGVEGIQLGTTYPGSAYLEFQQHVLALQRRGVLLAIASKNNLADVAEMFSRHPSMALREKDFADMQVHWEAKSESLLRIADKLGIGLEHIVFADDNPAECEQVRSALPAVTVLQLPPQPERYVEALHEDGWFDTLALSDEDLRRGDLYRQRAAAEELRSESVSLEDYYRALDMELRFAPVDRASLKRVAQLTQKTNQLNVSTRRYSEAQLIGLMDSADWLLVELSVSDRYGDNGIVGVMLARDNGEALSIDTFLLSCRVMGRAVETAMLAYLCDLASQRGLDALDGELIPTAKNLPVQDLFERHGFANLASEASGATRWRLRLSEQRVQRPDWFRAASGRTPSHATSGAET